MLIWRSVLFSAIYVELITKSTWGAQHPNFITVTHRLSFHELLYRVVAIIRHHLFIYAKIRLEGAKLDSCFVQNINYWLQLEHSVFQICLVRSNIIVVDKVEVWFHLFEMLSRHSFLKQRATNFISLLPVMPLVLSYIEATKDEETNKFPDLFSCCCKSMVVLLICIPIGFRSSQFNYCRRKHFFKHLNHR